MRTIEYQLGLGVNLGLITTFKANERKAHGPIGYHSAVFLTVGLISTLATLVIYLIIFPLH